MTMSAKEVRERMEKSSKDRKGGSKTPYLKIEAGKSLYLRAGPPWVKDGEVWRDRTIHGRYPDRVFCAHNDVDEKTGKKRKCAVCRKLAEIKTERTPYSKKL